MNYNSIFDSNCHC